MGQKIIFFFLFFIFLYSTYRIWYFLIKVLYLECDDLMPGAKLFTQRSVLRGVKTTLTTVTVVSVDKRGGGEAHICFTYTLVRVLLESRSLMSQGVLWSRKEHLGAGDCRWRSELKMCCFTSAMDCQWWIEEDKWAAETQRWKDASDYPSGARCVRSRKFRGPPPLTHTESHILMCVFALYLLWQGGDSLERMSPVSDNSRNQKPHTQTHAS